MNAKTPALPADPSRIRYLTLAIHLEEGGAPWLMRAAVWLAAAMIFLAVGWAATTVVPQVAQGPGEIVPAGNVLTVQHLEGGIVARIHVREGDIVEARQKLVEIDPTSAVAERDQLASREASLRLQAERLRAFADGRVALLAERGEVGLSADQAAILRTQERARSSQRAVLERQLAGRRGRSRSAAGPAADAAAPDPHHRRSARHAPDADRPGPQFAHHAARRAARDEPRAGRTFDGAGQYRARARGHRRSRAAPGRARLAPVGRRDGANWAA